MIVAEIHSIRPRLDGGSRYYQLSKSAWVFLTPKWQRKTVATRKLAWNVRQHPRKWQTFQMTSRMTVMEYATFLLLCPPRAFSELERSQTK